MRRNPYTSKRFVQAASHELQVAADAAMEGLARDPSNDGFCWVKPLMEGHVVGVDLLEPVAADLLRAGGDLTKLSPTLIPEGGVICPAGKFIMGSPEAEPQRGEDEQQHAVILPRNFAIGKYPVTHHLYLAVLRTVPSAFPGGGVRSRCPVAGVTWYDAVQFCNCLSDMLGLDRVYTDVEEESEVEINPLCNGFRLPTEAEWEYAARSGGDSFIYAGSNDADEVAWHAENSEGHIQDVGLKKPNRWGIYDMSGNVSEWVADHYSNYASPEKETSHRVYRGGNWATYQQYTRVAYRNLLNPDVESAVIGFRLCRTLSTRKVNPRRNRT